jgi:hypothetical protein
MPYIKENYCPYCGQEISNVDLQKHGRLVMGGDYFTETFYKYKCINRKCEQSFYIVLKKTFRNFQGINGEEMFPGEKLKAPVKKKFLVTYSVLVDIEEGDLPFNEKLKRERIIEIADSVLESNEKPSCIIPLIEDISDN